MELLKDKKHWFGWIFTAAVVIIVFHLLGTYVLYTPWYHILVLLGVIVGIDLIKHKIKWQ